MSAPGVTVMRAPMGGGWAWPLNKEGTRALFLFFNEPAAEIPIFVGEGAALRGYIIEPHDVEALAEHLQRSGVVWTVE